MEPEELLPDIRRRLVTDGFRVEADNATILGHEVLVARQSAFRLEWFATRLRVFVVVVEMPDLDEETVEAFTAAAQQYAIDHKGGIPRGLQTGTAAVPIFLSRDPRPDLHEWFGQRPRHRYAALRFPVLAECESATAVFFRRRAFVGGIYMSHLRDVVATALGPNVRHATPSTGGTA